MSWGRARSALCDPQTQGAAPLPARQVSREIEIHASMLHPNIVRLFAAFEDADGIYLVQEYAARGEGPGWQWELKAGELRVEQQESEVQVAGFGLWNLTGGVGTGLADLPYAGWLVCSQQELLGEGQSGEV